MWLKLEQGDTINATIDLSSVESVAKHWTGRRSELCLGQGCAHCLAGNPKRWRYQATVIVEGETLQWEFGEESLRDLNRVPHEINWAHISITRTGEGRNTRHRVVPGANPAETRPTATCSEPGSSQNSETADIESSRATGPLAACHAGGCHSAQTEGPGSCGHSEHRPRLPIVNKYTRGRYGHLVRY